MLDFLGNKVDIGDDIVFIRYKDTRLNKAKIVGIASPIVFYIQHYDRVWDSSIQSYNGFKLSNATNPSRINMDKDRIIKI